MQVGLRLPNAAGHARAVDASGLVALAESAERLGFDSVWASDRLATPLRTAAGASPWREEVIEPIALLTAVAARTDRIAIGTLDCVLPLRNPLFLAKAIATLDCIANGRLLFGVAEGDSPEEFAALGVEQHFEQRADVADEWLAVCRELWRDDDVPSSFEGRFVRFGHVGAYPKPVRKPHPPLYILDEGPRARSRLAEHGDGLVLDAASDAPIVEAVAQARERCEAAKRDFAPIDVCATLAVDRDGGAQAAVEAVATLEAAGVTHCLFELVPDRMQPPSSRALADAVHWLGAEVLPALSSSRGGASAEHR